jgi:hypothetical protein
LVRDDIATRVWVGVVATTAIDWGVGVLVAA